MNKIKITGDGTDKDTHVFLDDMDISRFVQFLTINLGVDQSPVVVLYCTGSLELPDEIKAEVVIYKESYESNTGA